MLGSLDLKMIGKIAQFLPDNDIASLSQVNKHINRAVKIAKWQVDIKKYFPYLLYTQPLAYEEDLEGLIERETARFMNAYGAEILDAYVDRTEHILGDDHSKAILLAAMAGDFAFLDNNPDLTQAERDLLNIVAVSNGRFGENFTVYNQLSNAQKIRAFTMAATNGNAHAVKEILKKDKNRIPLNERCDALKSAAYYGHVHVVQAIFTKGGGTSAENKQLKDAALAALHEAARHGQLPVVRYLFKKRVSLFQKSLSWDEGDYKNKRENELTLYYAYKNNDREMMRLFLEHGAEFGKFQHTTKKIEQFGLEHPSVLRDTVLGGALSIATSLITKSFYPLGFILGLPLFNILRDNFQHNAYEAYANKSKDQTKQLDPALVEAFKDGQKAATSTVDYFLSWTPLRANSLKHPKAFAAGFVAQKEKDAELIHRVRYRGN